MSIKFETRLIMTPTTWPDGRKRCLRFLELQLKSITYLKYEEPIRHVGVMYANQASKLELNIQSEKIYTACAFPSYIILYKNRKRS